MLVKDYQQQLSQKLTHMGSDTADLDARTLICHVMQLDLTGYIMEQNKLISAAEMNLLKQAEQQALAHKPISRIMKNREFWGLDFSINEHVLDPRADSEILIETLLNFIPPSDQSLKILDLGTGTGCLLLALLSEYKNATGLGADYSTQALKVAQLNAKYLGMESRTDFIQSDWFNSIPVQKFNIILSNPPYIPSQDIPKLAKNVKNYDPLPALDGGDDGLDPYHIITSQAADYLTKDGMLIFEMGHDQANGLFKILSKYGFDSAQFIMPAHSANQPSAQNGLGFDLGQNPRIIISQRQQS